MSAASPPPRLVTLLLRAALPEDLRGRTILGDLFEEWHTRPAGPRRALWFWREGGRVALRYLFVRRRLPGQRPGDGRRRRPSPSIPPLDEVGQTLRGVLRAPGATLLTVIALGTGIAAPTVMYSLLVGVTRDIPVPDPDAIVHVGRRFTPSIVRMAPRTWVLPFLEDPGSGGAELQAVGAFANGRWDLSGGGMLPERRQGSMVTPGVFAALAVPPALGRLPGDADVHADAGPVVVLSDALWRSRFGADPDVLGRRVRLDGRPHTVVGVMPPGFAFPDEAELWIPLDPTAPDAPSSVEVVGRLAPGASVEALRQRAAAVTGGLRASGDEEAVRAPRATLDAEPWSERAIDGDQRRMLRLMLVLVSFILVIACADVAHLFLARALARQRDAAVRLALGAGRWRVARRPLLEAALLAALGGVAGLALAAVGIRALEAGMSARLAWWMEIRLEPAVVLFATALVAAAGVLPALRATRVDPGASLREGGRGASGGRGLTRLTGLLVAAEVALTCTLLVVAGLLTRGALRSMDTDGSFATASVLTAAYELRDDAYPTADDVLSFHRELTDELGRRPDVAAVALVSHLPAIVSGAGPVEVEGETAAGVDVPRTHVVYASPGLLDALDVAPLRGRGFTWSDGATEPLAALVNEDFVRERLGGRDPLGLRLRLAAAGTDAASTPTPWATVVGVVPALGVSNARDPDPTAVYLPLSAAPQRDPWLLVRAREEGTAAALTPAVREAVAGLDADLAIYEAGTLEEKILANRDMERLFSAVFLLYGAAGLLLAGVGLYGLMLFTVGRRVRELGIRSAMGAAPARVAWIAVRAGALQVGAGLAVGLGLAAAVAPLLGTLFMGYEPRDPVAYGVVALTLLATGVAAVLTPVRRALALDVAAVLRAE